MARVSAETTGQAADADTRNATDSMIRQAHQRSVERAIIVWARKGWAAMAEWDEIRAEMRAASGLHPERVDVAPMEEPREPQICAWLKGIGGLPLRATPPSRAPLRYWRSAVRSSSTSRGPDYQRRDWRDSVRRGTHKGT
jgi:hypothetical protein